MNIKKPLAIVASIVSILLLMLAIWWAGKIGILFGFVIILVIWLNFARYLGFFSLPPLAKSLINGAMAISLIAIAIIGAVNQMPSISTPPAPDLTKAIVVVDYPLCAGGKHNFSNTRTGEVAVDFRPDCVSEVILPFQIAFRTDPSKDVKIVFLDGQSYVDGPERRVWYGYERSSIFTVRGLNSDGIMKISLGEKKKEEVI